MKVGSNFGFDPKRRRHSHLCVHCQLGLEALVLLVHFCRPGVEVGLQAGSMLSGRRGERPPVVLLKLHPQLLLRCRMCLGLPTGVQEGLTQHHCAQRRRECHALRCPVNSLLDFGS